MSGALGWGAVVLLGTFVAFALLVGGWRTLSLSPSSTTSPAVIWMLLFAVTLLSLNMTLHSMVMDRFCGQYIW